VSLDAQGAAEACALAVAGWLRAAIAERGVASLAVSGGSTPKLMFRVMTGLGLDWSKIHLFWVDERVVPPDDEQSNFRMTLENLITPAAIPAENVHRMFGEWDAVDAAMVYAQELERFFGTRVPVFDVVQCGVGDDAHTASLFPGEALIEDRRGVAAGIWVEKKKQWRITLLPAAILAARHLCVLSSGADKAEALHRALRGPEDPLGVPSQMLRDAEWFTDAAASSRL
jgi:6-phosphogluconolactonase